MNKTQEDEIKTERAASRGYRAGLYAGSQGPSDHDLIEVLLDDNHAAAAVCVLEYLYGDEWEENIREGDDERDDAREAMWNRNRLADELVASIKKAKQREEEAKLAAETADAPRKFPDANWIAKV